MHTHRNPADLVGLDRNIPLQRLLRACGTDEAYITGGASDYDRFLALAAVLPLCEGHPLRDEVNATLTQATGVKAPLCPHTARAHWDTWAEIYHYGGQSTVGDLPTVCPHCTTAAPRVIYATDCARLPDPIAIQAHDLTAWSESLTNALPKGGAPALYTLPEGYAFTRPNPYHAGLAVGKVAIGEALTPKERDILITQALRVWGLALTGKETAPLWILHGGTAEAVTALLAYLAASKALPDTVWIPDDPTQAETVSGLYPQVGTGYAEAADDSPEIAESKKAAYAAAAPMGRAILLIE